MIPYPYEPLGLPVRPTCRSFIFTFSTPSLKFNFLPTISASLCIPIPYSQLISMTALLAAISKTPAAQYTVRRFTQYRLATFPESESASPSIDFRRDDTYVPSLTGGGADLLDRPVPNCRPRDVRRLRPRRRLFHVFLTLPPIRSNTPMFNLAGVATATSSNLRFQRENGLYHYFLL